MGSTVSSSLYRAMRYSRFFRVAQSEKSKTFFMVWKFSIILIILMRDSPRKIKLFGLGNQKLLNTEVFSLMNYIRYVKLAAPLHVHCTDLLKPKYYFKV